MRKYTFFILVLVTYIAISCETKDSIVNDAYVEIVSILANGKPEIGYASMLNNSATGYGYYEVPGESIITTKQNSIKVDYSFVTGVFKKASATEVGEISNLRIKEDKDAPYILGDWQPHGSVGGIFSISKGDDGNIWISISCNGNSKISYSSFYSFNDRQYIQHITNVLKDCYRKVYPSPEGVVGEKLSGNASWNGTPHPTPEATLRSDIEHPKWDSMETVSFPLSRTFISSGSNFTVKGASDTYFAYIPSEHWGVLIMHYDNNSWAKRYIYCTGWDADNQTLSFSTYDQKTKKYIGILVGSFQQVDENYHYTATFTNYKGLQSATFYMVED